MKIGMVLGSTFPQDFTAGCATACGGEDVTDLGRIDKLFLTLNYRC